MDFVKVIIAAPLSLIALFLLTKLMGNKQISQLTTFDYITGITIGSIAAEMATDLEGSILPELIAMVIYGLVSFLISYATTKSMFARKVFTGKPLILFEKNKIYRNRLRKAHLDLNDFLSMCRLAGYFDLSQVETAIFEHNGNISFLPKSVNRPLTPTDTGANVESETPYVDLIIDGKVIEENLQDVGKNMEWIKKTVKEYGYKGIDEVLLLLTDESNNVRIYGFENKGKK